MVKTRAAPCAPQPTLSTHRCRPSLTAATTGLPSSVNLEPATTAARGTQTDAHVLQEIVALTV